MGEIPLNRNGKHLYKMKKWSHLIGNYEGESLICVTSIWKEFWLVSVQSRLNQVTDESSSVGKALSDWYEQHGIDVYDKQTGQIRSLYDILTDLAPKWKDLSKNEQAYYLNQQAGRCAPLKWIDGNLLRAL